MASDLEQLTAAGGTITLGRTTYLMKQLTLGDYGQLQAWLRAKLPKPFAVVADALKDLQPLKTVDPEGYALAREQLMRAAMDDARKGDQVGGPPELVQEALNGPEGVSMILWLCVRKSHPDVTYEVMRAAVNAENLTSIKSQLDAITVFAGSGVEEGDPFLAPPATPPAPPTTT
jgi:hypothetical protein